MVPVISLEAAVAVSGRFPVLTGVDLTIDPGSIVLLEAPNGAGKTSQAWIWPMIGEWSGHSSDI